MKTIRQGTFETNSSSCHSITVPRKNVAIPITAQEIIVGIGEYGWEFETYNTPKEICGYLYTAICSLYKLDYKKYTDKIDKVLADNTKTKIVWEEPKWSHSYNEDGSINYTWLEGGYIDHSDELEEWLDDLFSDDDLLLKTIFAGEIETGDDNTFDDDYSFSGTSSLVSENYYTYYKGN